jgi:hypothetical protein
MPVGCAGIEDGSGFGINFHFSPNSLTTLTKEKITRYFTLVYLLSTIELRLVQSQGSMSVGDIVVLKNTRQFD